MIVGLGLDVVAIDAFALLLETEHSDFSAHTFTDAEVTYSRDQAKGRAAEHLAVRFAAKEAALKALDQASGLRAIDPGVVDLIEIEVVRDRRGRPALALHGKADRLANAVGADRALVTLSHDGNAAVAIVVLERLDLIGPT